MQSAADRGDFALQLDLVNGLDLLLSDVHASQFANQTPVVIKADRKSVV